MGTSVECAKFRKALCDERGGRVLNGATLPYLSDYEMRNKVTKLKQCGYITRNQRFIQILKLIIMKISILLKRKGLFDNSDVLSIAQ